MKALLIAIVLVVFAACGGNGGENGDGGNSRSVGGGAHATPLATGRHVEIEITPPIQDRLISLVAQDGTLVVFDEGLRTRFESTDMGETWVQSQGVGYGTDLFSDVNNAGILPDGRLLVYLQGEGMTAVEQDGTTQHIPIAGIDRGIADGDEFTLQLIEVLDNERVMLTYSIDWFARFMRENEDFQMFEEDEYDDEENEDDENGGGIRTGTVRVGGNVGGGGMLSFPGTTTAIYDIATGQQLQLISYEEFLTMTPMGANADGDIYTIENHNLVRHGINGDVDILLHGTAFAFGAPVGMTSSITPIEDGFIVNVTQFENMMMVSQIFKYVWDAEAFVDPSQTITIWSLEDNPTVRAAITEIWRNNPNADITYEIALYGDTAISAADAIRTLNTRLLSGRGPDILILDGTPIDSYAGRGMLLDLSERVSTGDMYQNILAPFTDNGQMYVIPMQFTIPMLIGEGQHLNQAPTLSALVQGILESNPLPEIDENRWLGGTPEDERAKIAFNDLPELFEIMWQTGAAAFITDNRLDSDILREFLAAIEAINDKFELAQNEAMMSGGVMMVSGGGVGRANIIGGSVMQFLMQNTNIGAFEAGNISMLYSFMNRNRDNIFMDIALFPGLVQGAWTPSTIVGVYADTPVVDFSIEFVNTMLSQEVQRVNHGMGFPVIRDAMEWQIAQINEQIAEFGLSGFDMAPFEINMDEIIAQLQTPALPEATLREMIWTTVERLAQGRVDIEGAVQEIEQNIRNYLAERS
ncbi:MAG: ABC transporter substrate-binding protein [Defluviitaleaceae bacterium]|nr:ABC transporter substrate-binding protein [Defluviitaleaceae bacterium]